MRVLVCGGRTYYDRERLWRLLDELHHSMHIDCILEGGQTGADQLAFEWSQTRDVAVETYMAAWKRYGLAAGPTRNLLMLKRGLPDMVVAAPGGTGTQNMIEQATLDQVDILMVQE